MLSVLQEQGLKNYVPDGRTDGGMALASFIIFKFEKRPNDIFIISTVHIE